MSSTTVKVMVLIPCYGEAENIGGVVSRCVSLGFPTVVVDDGSKDDTARIAEAAGATVIRHEANHGKGAAIATGLEYATTTGYEAIVMMDGDAQHLPEEIVRFADRFAAERPDFIIGTRMAHVKNMPLIRYLTNRFMSWLLSREIGQRVSDTQCGFRLISAKVIPVALSCTSSGFSAESEILLQLGLGGYRISEVDVSTIYGSEKSKIKPVRDTIRFFKMLKHFRSQRRKLGSANK